jgi:hypothetical protein
MTHKPEFDTKAKKSSDLDAQPAISDASKHDAKIVHHYGPNAVMRAAP